MLKHEIDQLIACLEPYQKYLFAKCNYCKQFEESEFDYCTCSKSKSLGEFRKKLETKQSKHYYLFKVTKSHDMLEAKFVELCLALPEKFKGWFNNYHFSVEFNVESGVVPHTHIVLSDVNKRKDKLTKKHAQLVKYFNTPDNMVYRSEIDKAHYNNKVNYIKGLKDPTKQHLVEMDNNSRKKYNLDVYYNDATQTT